MNGSTILSSLFLLGNRYFPADFLKKFRPRTTEYL
jgi:hypothetical protein